MFVPEHKLSKLVVIQNVLIVFHISILLKSELWRSASEVNRSELNCLGQSGIVYEAFMTLVSHTVLGL